METNSQLEAVNQSTNLFLESPSIELIKHSPSPVDGCILINKYAGFIAEMLMKDNSPETRETILTSLVYGLTLKLLEYGSKE